MFDKELSIEKWISFSRRGIELLHEFLPEESFLDLIEFFPSRFFLLILILWYFDQYFELHITHIL